MKKLFGAFALLMLLSACTQMKVVKVDDKTGYFPGAGKAPVVQQKAIALDERKSLVVVGNSEFMLGQLKNLQYFDEVITVEELEKRIINANLGDKVPSLRERIGLNNAAKHYKPFLWFRFDKRGTGTDSYGQFILPDPVSMEDLFVTETHLDYVWAGVNDQHNWYPMFNSLIDYVRENSASYGRN